MNKKEMEKYVDESMKRYFFEIKKGFVEFKKNTDVLEEITQKRLIETKKYIEDKKTQNKEYSDDIKQLIKDDIDDRNKKILSEIKNILPGLVSSKNSNLSYIYMAIGILFLIEIFLLIFK